MQGIGAKKTTGGKKIPPRRRVGTGSRDRLGPSIDSRWDPIEQSAGQRRRWESNPRKTALQAVAQPLGLGVVDSEIFDVYHKRPRQESNLVLDLRGVACHPPHSEDVASLAVFRISPPPGNRTRPCGFEDRRASDTPTGNRFRSLNALARSRTWSSTFGGSRAIRHAPRANRENGRPSRDARIRTLSASFGGSPLSQEHVPLYRENRDIRVFDGS